MRFRFLSIVGLVLAAVCINADHSSASTILTPGDTILAIDLDGNSNENDPNEGVIKAIDGIIAGNYYLNVGGRNSGFIVTPSFGSSIVTSFDLWTGYDVVGRDPLSYSLSGTNDTIASLNDSTGTAETWNLISSGALALPQARSTMGPTVSFTNTAAYSSYRLVFPTLKSNGGWMQISEVQFRGTAAAPEPTSIAMWGLGAIGTIFARRRHQLTKLSA